ncbi:DUF6093 family protein [Solicola gregarius]|uniref:DUF6093 family protein n=1 Tax=Solicola gregarius TaxID=2908642 RepID=A0AA46YK80_9ACTN|nr:DUF6093 family protein [Solicola gregarius]UYM04211.1 DUF6093 family protein [Solicola gregarius]
MLSDTGTVSYDTGETEWDDEIGEETPIFADRYTGPMLVRPQYATPAEFDAGGAQWTVSRYDVTLPADTDVRIGDRVQVESTFDTKLADTFIYITDVPLDSWQIARFCIAEKSSS